MDLDQARTLLAEAERHRQPAYEPSIFALGGRGYYENPTTDLLAFFLDPNQVHGFGDCFLGALLGCICKESPPEPTLRLPPQREVTTTNGKRIDLLLQGEDWLLILENKIFHAQVNPFADYELYAETLVGGRDKRVLFAVLSPSGSNVADGWTGLSYADLLGALRRALSQNVEHSRLNKWRVLADEFLLHLENITVERDMNPESIDFIFDHLPQINALNKLRDQALEALDSKIIAHLQAEIDGFETYTRRQPWADGPALRYACNDWVEWSDVVLYLDGSQAPLRPTIRVYLINVDTRQMEFGRHLFLDTTRQPWTEGRRVIGFEWKLESFDERVVIDTVLEKMRLLMQFEAEMR
ncbi:hypothetical protein EON09_20270 [Pseudomonas soli]|jgi:hypothetical protein|uniref:PD-(D/E)XK nuclease family protein n=1 Tax=Pseudomonas soli TaxID=1306993 RepID=A0A1H9DHV1_9PSED|nr:PD-(D/E)XK nuclease family protein [Pseudomonas soli]MEE1882788.1 PD-(D/E)XK nuclease family protein [Pseudomonas soli]NBK40857.1 hypothetical protein [Pseudomonas soli]WJO24185.1 PD-(D/E)XK nuclease family protein [Pseudomonas soli]SEQ13070.1 PD-(D/E)XK nuclease superfamily protein [Pseudomonas soli]